MEDGLQLIECPRDAMQGWKTMIPAQQKINYINALLRVGFHTIDMGSFVSSRLIPQMADTPEVVEGIDTGEHSSALLTIVANTQGAEAAVKHSKIDYLGFPFSVSPTFQLRNTNSSPEESLVRVKDIHSLCVESGKKMVVYMSMGFGNPYGDLYNTQILCSWIERISSLGIDIISLADTVGLATPEQVYGTVREVLQLYPGVTVGVHLHSRQENMLEKLDAAYRAGCRRFDGAINGIGGCPMAEDELVGNMDTIGMVKYFRGKGHCSDIDIDALEECRILANDIFLIQ